METETDTRIGKYLSSTGMVHTSRGCGTRGRRRPSLITQDDVDYWSKRGTTHDLCEHCTKAVAR